MPKFLVSIIIITVINFILPTVSADWNTDLTPPTTNISVSGSGSGCTTSGSTTNCPSGTTVTITITCNDTGGSNCNSITYSLNGVQSTYTASGATIAVTPLPTITSSTSTPTITAKSFDGAGNIGNDTTWQINFVSAPTCNLKIDNSDGPLNVGYSTNHILSWTTTGPPTTLTASGSWSGAKSVPEGSAFTGSLQGASYTYTISGSNAYGSCSDSVTANVGPGPFNVGTNPSTGSCPTPTITLTWTNSALATQYHIYRSQGGGSYLYLTTVNAPALSYPDSSITSGLTYAYYVVATNSYGSINSNTTTNSVVAPDPCIPTVSCLANPVSVTTGQNVTWSATPSGGSGSGYTYSWTGTDGLTGTAQSVLKSYATTGPKTASVTVTDSLSNNSPATACSNTVTVTTTPQPDLIVQSCTYTPPTPVAGNNMNFSAVIKNQGNADANASLTEFALDVNNNSSAADDPPIASITTPSSGVIVANGGITTVNWTANWPASAGMHKLTVDADWTDVIDELEESNNQCTALFIVSSGASPAPSSSPGSSSTPSPSPSVCPIPGSFTINPTPTTGCSGSTPYIDVSGASASSNATSYDIYRNDQVFPIASIPVTQTTYRDQTVISGIQYYYWAVANNSCGSTQSNTTNFVTAPSCGGASPSPSPSPVTIDLLVDGQLAGFDGSIAITAGSSHNLTWSSTNATSCTASATPISGTWTGSKATSNGVGESTGVLNSPPSSYTYRLDCTNGSTSAFDSVNLTLPSSLPWLKTTGGDVHTNTTITAPGGP